MVLVIRKTGKKNQNNFGLGKNTQIILIEAGTPGELENKRNALKLKSIEKSKLKDILLVGHTPQDARLIKEKAKEKIGL